MSSTDLEEPQHESTSPELCEGAEAQNSLDHATAQCLATSRNETWDNSILDHTSTNLHPTQQSMTHTSGHPMRAAPKRATALHMCCEK